MHLIKLDRKEKMIVLRPETLDDLWHLEKAVEKGDIVKGSTSRKVKIEGTDKSVRKKLFVELEAQEAEFSRIAGTLRVNGKMLSGKPEELIEVNAFQSVDFEQGEKIEIRKRQWSEFIAEKLRKIEKTANKKPIVLVVLDDESADIALLKEFNLEQKATIRSKKSGKAYGTEDWKEKYLQEIYLKIKDIDAELFVFAGPGFVKEDLREFFSEKGFKGKIVEASINSTGITGMNELMKGKQLNRLVEETELAKENRLVEKIFEELGRKTGLAEYGLSEVGNAVNAGAVEELLIEETFFSENREKIEAILKAAEQSNAKIRILSSEHDSGKKLAGLGGIAALLRYRLN